MFRLEESQKNNTPKKSKRAFGAFIHNVSWWRRVTYFELDNSYIYKRIKTVTYKNGKTSQTITLPHLPRWKDVTRIQKGAYCAKFLIPTKEFSYLKPYTLRLSDTLNNKLKQEKWLADIRKAFNHKRDGILRYHNQGKTEIMSIIEGKSKVLHEHGWIGCKNLNDSDEQDNHNDLSTLLKRSACTHSKEYKKAKYRTMLKFSECLYWKRGGSYGWYCYMNKGSHSENGFHLSRPLYERIRDDYEEFYEQYTAIIKQLEAEGFIIRYKDAKRKEYHKRFDIWKDIAKSYKGTLTTFKQYILNARMRLMYLIRPPPLLMYCYVLLDYVYIIDGKH